MNGLLSPEDEFIADYSSAGLLAYDNPNFRAFTFLPIGSDASLPYPQRLSTYRPAVPQFITGALESFKIPEKARRGDYGVASIDNPAFMDATTQFSLDFGLLPAVRGLVSPPAPNTLSMSGGGQGAVRNVRSVDDMGFYSEALEQAKLLPMEKGTGEQFRQMLLKKGVKPDEIKFTPELEGLLSQPRVTKDELVGLLDSERVRPYETQLLGNDPEFEGMRFPSETEALRPDAAYGPYYISERAEEMLADDAAFVFENYGKRGRTDEEISDIVRQIEDNGFESLDGSLQNEIMEYAERQATEEYFYDPVELLRDPDTGYEIIGSDEMGWTIKDADGNYINSNHIGSLSEARIQAETHAIDEGLVGYGGGETRFSEYTEDGGIDYRERLIQIENFEGSTGEDFVYGAHFDEPNVAVHARTKTRKMEDGEDTLYVEELQSDWGQKGRRLGFASDPDTLDQEISNLKGELDLAKEARDTASAKIKEATDRFGNGLAELVTQKTGQKALYNDAQGIVFFETPPISPSTLTPQSQLIYNASQMKQMFTGENPADFAESVFNIIREGDVTFTPDEFDAIRTKNWAELTEARDATSNEYARIHYKIEELNEMPPQAPFVTGSEKFTELGLKSLLKAAVDQRAKYLSFSSGDVQYSRWGEKGLVDYYDKIIPKVAKKVAKRLDPDAFVGVKDVEGVEDLGGNKGRGRMVIEITPKMIEAIKGGQPLFSAPSLPMSGILSDDKAQNKKPTPTGGILY